MEAATEPTSSRTRPCRGCDGELPSTRVGQARYCSLPCRKRTNRNNHIESEREACRRANRRRWATDPAYREAQRQRVKEWRQKQTYGRVLPINEMYKDRYRAARALGYRSGLEVSIANALTEMGVAFTYETLRIPFVQPAKPRYYCPDVILPNGIIIEGKGRMLTGDRQKHIMVKAQHPDLDIRFVFSNSRTRISKKSKTTYADWCQKHRLHYADKQIPSTWINEKPNKRSLAAIQRLMEER